MCLVHIRGKIGDDDFVGSGLGGGGGGDDDWRCLDGGDASAGDRRWNWGSPNDLRAGIAASRGTTTTPAGAVGGDDLCSPMIRVSSSTRAKFMLNTHLIKGLVHYS